MTIFDTGAARALNLLLAREAWAREKLAPFAGEIVEVRCGPLPPLRFKIGESGHALSAGDGIAATLVVSAAPGILAAMFRGEEHLLRAVEISGNEALAAEVLALARYLRWDIEEDLSRIFGDVLAHRMAATARDFFAWQAEAGRRLVENAVEYAVEERRIVVSRAEFDAFSADVARLRDDLARLEQRLERRPDAAPT